MHLQFVGKNIEVTPAIKSVTEEKFKLLEKRFSNMTNVTIVFHVEHNIQIVEATLHCDGTEIHATAKDNDMYKAIDILIAKLLGQMTRHREKIIDSHR
jgi:putative sigma-54 modulation protein